MSDEPLLIGAAEGVITPPVGVRMTGWMRRARPDNLAHYVHDDLYTKALVARRGDDAWAIISNDLALTDPITASRIRQGVASEVGLDPAAVMICATHTHSGPITASVATVLGRAKIERRSMKADGSQPQHDPHAPMQSSDMYIEDVDDAWREHFIAEAVAVAARAARTMKPAEVAFSEAPTEGIVSSRRVLLSDGTWADPRIQQSPEAQVVHRSQIDPAARICHLRDSATRQTIALVVNLDCHPWVYSGSGISAEIPGNAARKLARRLSHDDASPVVLHLTGPEGDATTIWNVDVEHLWKPQCDNLDEDLERREALFWHEVDRLGDQLVEAAMKAVASGSTWQKNVTVAHRREELLLPLKDGYERPAHVRLADWQLNAPPLRHRTEVQVLQLGDGAFLALPGEPFTAIGRAIRQSTSFEHLLTAALANDCGEVVYIAPREECDLGGYEIDSFAIAVGAGEMLVECAARALASCRDGS